MNKNKKLSENLPSIIYIVAFVVISASFWIFNSDYGPKAIISSFTDFASAFEEGFNSSLNQQGLLDINSTVGKLTLMQEKNGVFASGDYYSKECPESESTDEIVASVADVSEYANGQKIPFLYVNAPFKGDTDDFTFPVGVFDYSGKNTDAVMKGLTESDVPTLDLREYFSHKSDFYRTDHHWRIETAYEASGIIARQIAEAYDGIIKDSDLAFYTDRNNYDFIHATDSYAGSLARTAGVGFTGTDEFVYVIPKFDTSLSYMHINNSEITVNKAGNFSEALISDPDESDYYCSYLNNSYCEMIIENAICNNDKKLLIISDSFGRPLAAYMSMYFSQIVNVDTQKGRYNDSIYELIDTYRPDMVLMCIHGGLYNDASAFDFRLPTEYHSAVTPITEKQYEDIYYTYFPTDDKQVIYKMFDRLATTHQEIAYMVSSEVLRYKNGNTDSQYMVKYGTQYLLDHSDENNDGEVGFGLRYEFDAFQDGTVNPKNHVYGIQVANVTDALLDALETDLFSESETDAILTVLYELTATWNTKYYSYTSDNTAFYWYSIAECDAKECYNISAKVAGAFARVIGTYPELFTDSELQDFSKIIHANMRSVYNNLQVSTPLPEKYTLVWNYCVQNDTVNDLVHHAFIIEGIAEYQQYMKDTIEPPPYTMYEMNAYARRCVVAGRVFMYPGLFAQELYHCESVRCFDNGAYREAVLQWAARQYESEIYPFREVAFYLYSLAWHLYAGN